MSPQRLGFALLSWYERLWLARIGPGPLGLPADIPRDARVGFLRIARNSAQPSVADQPGGARRVTFATPLNALQPYLSWTLEPVSHLALSTSGARRLLARRAVDLRARRGSFFMLDTLLPLWALSLLACRETHRFRRCVRAEEALGASCRAVLPAGPGAPTLTNTAADQPWRTGSLLVRRQHNAGLTFLAKPHGNTEPHQRAVAYRGEFAANLALGT
jgi:hypothetical protein